MKLIIDISEEDYIKANAGILGSLGDIIANGKPYEDRPQGEWIVKSNGTTNYCACDKCGSAGDIQDKFCRECGADMRGAE